MRSVKSPPDDFDDSRLLPSLAEGWGIESRSAEYLTVGFGSYHWLVTDTTGRRLFVTVDDLRHKEWLGNTPEAALGGLRNAFDAALSLRDEGGLDFVIAALPTPRGETVRRIGMRHAVAVFPFIPGRPGHFGDDGSPAERAEVAGMLAKLHRPASVAPRSAVRREPGITARDNLEEALADVNHPWSGGPFSEPSRDWLARNAADLRGQLCEFDRLAARVAAAERALVVTHGEPHPGNLIRTGSGLVLVDWDTVALALPERDLWLVTTGADEAAMRYTDATGRDIDGEALSIYRLAWDLTDIALFTKLLRSAHRRTSDTEAAWLNLTTGAWFGAA
jgi:spectinomycin phosphotransferase